MNKNLLSLLVAATLGVAVQAAAAPAQAAPATADAQAEVPVIVRFADHIDLKAIRGAAEHELERRYSDREQRRAKRDGLRRKLMVDGMKAKSGAALKQLRKFLKSRGLQRDLKPLWAINGAAVTIPADLIDDLKALPGVESVAPDATIQGPGPGIPPTAPNLWNLDATHAPQLWQQGHTGTGVVVASMDTGIDTSHGDLGPRWRGGGNSWFDAYGQHSTPADGNGHGTQVMGLIVGGAAYGYQIGMAPDARWISAKIFNDANQASLSAIHAGYQWMLDPDGNPSTDDSPDLVNNSWALDSSVNQCNQEFSQDVALLKEAGIAVLFSGGNYGPGSDTSVSPANAAGVVSVGAVDQYSTVAGNSSRGANACDGGIYPNLVAPGVNVLTATPGSIYTLVSGTSYAVAHVAGGMALLKGAFPTATVAELEAALIDGATDLGVPGPDNSYGHGMLDVLAAYQRLESGSTPPPVQPGSFSFNLSGYSVAENVANLTVTINRSGGSGGAVAVDYATADGTALAGLDYQAAAGTLNFADGETSRSFDLTLIDDTVYEGDEGFILNLFNATGGAGVTTPSAVVTVAENDPLPPADADGDGYVASNDCNDQNAAIHPGATEVKSDGIDQDCNGYDLTINLTRLWYTQSTDQVTLWATSARGAAAGLQARIALANGKSFSKAMNWNSSQKRWQLTVNSFVAKQKSMPVTATVSGAEGAESGPFVLR